MSSAKKGRLKDFRSGNGLALKEETLKGRVTATPLQCSSVDFPNIAVH